MKVEVSEIKTETNRKVIVILDIIFRKTNTNERRRYNNKVLIDTACMIFRDDREIACAIARQNPLDDYNKIVGKKVALAKAIDKIEFLKSIPKSMMAYHHHHEMRRHIWEVFHQTFGRWN